MTGAMCIIGAGSSTQPMIGTLIQLFFLLLVIQLAPYEEYSDDMASFVSSLTLTLTLFAAFAISNTNPDNGTYDADMIGIMMISISVLCLVFELGLAAYDLDLPCTRNTKFKKMNDARKNLAAEANKTKVAPLSRGEKEQKRDELKRIRLKYGASSEEYQAAAGKVCGSENGKTPPPPPSN